MRDEAAAEDAPAPVDHDHLVQQLLWGLHRITAPKRRGPGHALRSLVAPVEARGVALGLRERVRRTAGDRDARAALLRAAAAGRGHLFFATRRDLDEHLAGLCAGALADGAPLAAVLTALDEAVARFGAEHPELPPAPPPGAPDPAAF